jgi:HEAT repeat protein
MPDAGATERRRQIALAGHGVTGGGDAVVQVRGGLEDADPSVRATALGALARLGELTEADIEVGAVDPDERVRSRTAELAAPFGSVVAPVLTGLLADRQAAVVEAACFGLGELGSHAGETEMAALAAVSRDHDDALCRESAVAAIGAIAAAESTDLRERPPSAVGRAAVLAAMADKPAVRRRAVLALIPFEGPEVDAALETALADRDWQVRQAAEDMTGRRRPT